MNQIVLTDVDLTTDLLMPEGTYIINISNLDNEDGKLARSIQYEYIENDNKFTLCSTLEDKTIIIRDPNNLSKGEKTWLRNMFLRKILYML